jgi:hypothetical protein
MLQIININYSWQSEGSYFWWFLFCLFICLFILLKNKRFHFHL